MYIEKRPAVPFTLFWANKKPAGAYASLAREIQNVIGAKNEKEGSQKPCL